MLAGREIGLWREAQDILKHMISNVVLKGEFSDASRHCLQLALAAVMQVIQRLQLTRHGYVTLHADIEI
jgi:hypothetical protein